MHIVVMKNEQMKDIKNISDDEQELLGMFRQLNKSRRDRIIGMLELYTQESKEEHRKERNA